MTLAIVCHPLKNRDINGKRNSNQPLSLAVALYFDSFPPQTKAFTKNIYLYPRLCKAFFIFFIFCKIVVYFHFLLTSLKISITTGANTNPITVSHPVVSASLPAQ
ncbi:hypothetical protein [Eubacterium sp.]|uniref:hypothetical protein n=1 Tax=Eubacterium sp. TaxID=142586 RepID=UPI0030D90FEC